MGKNRVENSERANPQSWFDKKTWLHVEGCFLRKETIRVILFILLRIKEKRALKLAHPGRIVRDEILKPRNISHLQFSEMLGDTVGFAEEFLSGGYGVNYEFDKKLSKVLGVPRSYLLSAQEEWTKRNVEYTNLAMYLAWVSRGGSRYAFRFLYPKSLR